MKHSVRRELELTGDEIRQAIIYWLKNDRCCSTPDDRDAVTFVFNEVTGSATAFVAWSEDVSE